LDSTDAPVTSKCKSLENYLGVKRIVTDNSTSAAVARQRRHQSAPPSIQQPPREKNQGDDTYTSLSKFDQEPS